jgi:hypothetical protein
MSTLSISGSFALQSNFGTNERQRANSLRTCHYFDDSHFFARTVCCGFQLGFKIMSDGLKINLDWIFSSVTSVLCEVSS